MHGSHHDPQTFTKTGPRIASYVIDPVPLKQGREIPLLAVTTLIVEHDGVAARAGVRGARSRTRISTRARFNENPNLISPAP